MDFGAIIKRAWHITWHYKPLWVLGIFAGVSGCQASGPSSSGSNWQSDMGRLGDSPQALGGFGDTLLQYLPVLIALGIGLIALSIVWAVLSIAARSGLIIAVNDIEEGRERRLGELWSLGFSRFWPVVGFGLLLNLPVIIVAFIMGVVIALPLMQMAFSGREPGVEMFAPLCGSLGIGVPLLIVLSLIIGILYLVGLRYVVIGRQGPIEAIRNAWSFFRIRFKDSALMYLLSGALNIAASIVLAIPIVLIFVGLAFPAFAAYTNRDWTALLAPVGVGLLLIVLVGWFYSAVWGTFTSSLWTLFFRQVVGLQPAAAAAAPVYSAPSYDYPTPPSPPVSEPPAPPLPPEPTAPAAQDV